MSIAAVKIHTQRLISAIQEHEKQINLIQQQLTDLLVKRQVRTLKELSIIQGPGEAPTVFPLHTTGFIEELHFTADYLPLVLIQSGTYTFTAEWENVELI